MHKHHQHEGDGIRVVAYQKLKLRQVLLTTWQIIFGNPYHRCVIANQGFSHETAQYLLLPLAQAQCAHPQFVTLQCVAITVR